MSCIDVMVKSESSRSEVPVWKRALDLSCIALALPVLVPVMALIGGAIWLVSRGPVLYLSERVGYQGRRFVCFKFRTMKVNADVGIHQKHLESLMRADVPMVKMDAKGDPRLIPFGSLLRATGLDELPQLFNVIGGEMSLVGPRPCIPYEYDNYAPAQKSRFNTLPGLTGLWQVSGKNKTTFSEMIALDIQYAETKSLWLDLKIMIKTPLTLLGQVVESKMRRRTVHQVAMPQPEGLSPRSIRVDQVLVVQKQ